MVYVERRTVAPSGLGVVPTTIVRRTQTLKTEVKIEGMTCGHCEARVKKSLEALASVELAEVSHVAGNARVTHGDEVSMGDLAAAVTKAGYKPLP